MRHPLNLGILVFSTFLLNSCLIKPPEITPLQTHQMQTIAGNESKQIDYDEEEEEEDDEDEDDTVISGEEVFFRDSHGIIFKMGQRSENIVYNTTISLLSSLKKQVKKKLRHKLRRKKPTVTLVVKGSTQYHDDIRIQAQKFIAKYNNLQAQDDLAQRVISRVIIKESDAIFSQDDILEELKTTDLIYLIKHSETNGWIKMNGWVMTKNNQYVAVETTKAKLSRQTNGSSDWFSIDVPTNSNPITFEVMKKTHLSEKSKSSRTKVTLTTAEDICQRIYGAQVVSLYVFEYSRRSNKMKRPNGVAIEELVAPYDEEENAHFYKPGDHVITENDTSVIFNWNSQQYFSMSSVYNSGQTAFRCMRQ